MVLSRLEGYSVSHKPIQPKEIQGPDAFRVDKFCLVCLCVCMRMYSLMCALICVSRMVLAKNKKYTRTSLGLWNLR